MCYQNHLRTLLPVPEVRGFAGKVDEKTPMHSFFSNMKQEPKVTEKYVCDLQHVGNETTNLLGFRNTFCVAIT